MSADDRQEYTLFLHVFKSSGYQNPADHWKVDKHKGKAMFLSVIS